MAYQTVKKELEVVEEPDDVGEVDTTVPVVVLPIAIRIQWHSSKTQYGQGRANEREPSRTQ